MLEAALVSLLTGNTPLNQIVGGRIRPGLAGQEDDRPYVTLQRVSTDAQRTNDGPSGFVLARVQIDSWADTYLGARQLADAVRRAIDGYRGDVGAVAIHAIFREDERDLPEPPADGRSKPIYRVSTDYLAIYAEPIT